MVQRKRLVLSLSLFAVCVPALALGATVDDPGFKKHIAANGFDELADVVTSAGDVDGDGYEDFLMSASDYDGQFARGAVYLRYGDEQPLSGGVNVSTLASFVGEENIDLLGLGVDGVGDFNGDGYDDFVIGSPGAGLDGKAYFLAWQSNTLLWRNNGI